MNDTYVKLVALVEEAFAARNAASAGLGEWSKAAALQFQMHDELAREIIERDKRIEALSRQVSDERQRIVDECALRLFVAHPDKSSESAFAEAEAFADGRSKHMNTATPA